MTINYNRKRGTPLTPEQIAEVREAAKRPIVFDEDCPELSDKMMKSFECAVRNRNRIKSINDLKAE